MKLRNGPLRAIASTAISTTRCRRQVRQDDRVLRPDGELVEAVLPGIHSDPFDRLLVAQAMRTSMRLVTGDESILAFAGVDGFGSESVAAAAGYWATIARLRPVLRSRRKE